MRESAGFRSARWLIASLSSSARPTHFDVSAGRPFSNMHTPVALILSCAAMMVLASEEAQPVDIKQEEAAIRALVECGKIEHTEDAIFVSGEYRPLVIDQAPTRATRAELEKVRRN